MNIHFKLPPFGKFATVLNAAGVKTGSARGFWGGVTSDGAIVLTSWLDTNNGAGGFYVWRPTTNHGGLKTQWEVGNIRVGIEVRLILLRQRGNLPIGEPGRVMAGAVLMPGKWKVTELVTGKDWAAIVEPAAGV